jgi:hypothetical protein
LGDDDVLELVLKSLDPAANVAGMAIEKASLQIHDDERAAVHTKGGLPGARRLYS